MRNLLCSIVLIAPLTCHAATEQKLDCQQPQNTRECTAQSMVRARDTLQTVAQNLQQQLVGFAGKEYAQHFASIESQWMSLTSKQCDHVRGLYGQGSLGPIAGMTCRERLYKERVKTLKDLYSDVLNPR